MSIVIWILAFYSLSALGALCCVLSVIKEKCEEDLQARSSEEVYIPSMYWGDAIQSVFVCFIPLLNSWVAAAAALEVIRELKNKPMIPRRVK